MKRFLVAIILLIALLKPNLVESQNVKPYFYWAWFDEDNAIALDTTQIVGHVKLKSCETDIDTTGTGILYYWYQTSKTIDEQGPTYYKLLIPNYDVDTIYPSGIVDYFSFVCDTNDLYPRQNETGPTNVIIIWPAFLSPGTPLCDSGMYIFSNILIDNPWIGIEEENPQDFGSIIFPNPANNYQDVFIKTNYSKSVEKVTISNSLGITISDKPINGNNLFQLSTNTLSRGLYYVRIYYSDKKSEVVKFIKN